MISNVSRAAPTSKNYQNFLRAGEKSLLFSGSDQSDVNEWLVSVEELADTHGADYEEVLRGVQSLLSKSAKRFYREHLVTVRAANEFWDWDAAKSWFLRKFNPESRILRKVTEYHRCAQGRRSVNDTSTSCLSFATTPPPAPAPTSSSASVSSPVSGPTFSKKFASTWRLSPAAVAAAEFFWQM